MNDVELVCVLDKVVCALMIISICCLLIRNFPPEINLSRIPRKNTDEDLEECVQRLTRIHFAQRKKEVEKKMSAEAKHVESRIS